MASARARQQGTGNRSSKAKQKSTAGPSRLGTWAWVAGGIVVALVAVAVAVAVASGGTESTSKGTVVQGNGDTWTNIPANVLAAKMKTKDFTLLNVKTPYIGEIQGTDLYIPYNQLTARAAELPADKTAPIVVYCRTGNESAIAAQTLLDLGYTNIESLDGGMTAWVASGRQLVRLNRS